MENNISNDKEKVSFFKKISNFFRAIFKQNKNLQLAEGKTELNSIDKAKNDFWKNIRLEEDLEDRELIETQRKFITKEISMADLTEQQIIDLTALYKRQTERLVRKTEQIQAETDILNEKIARLKGEISQE